MSNWPKFDFPSPKYSAWTRKRSLMNGEAAPKRRLNFVPAIDENFEKSSTSSPSTSRCCVVKLDDTKTRVISKSRSMHENVSSYTKASALDPLKDSEAIGDRLQETDVASNHKFGDKVKLIRRKGSDSSVDNHQREFNDRNKQFRHCHSVPVFDLSYVSPVLDNSFLKRAKHKESLRVTPPSDAKYSQSHDFEAEPEIEKKSGPKLGCELRARNKTPSSKLLDSPDVFASASSSCDSTPDVKLKKSGAGISGSSDLKKPPCAKDSTRTPPRQRLNNRLRVLSDSSGFSVKCDAIKPSGVNPEADSETIPYVLPGFTRVSDPRRVRIPIPEQVEGGDFDVSLDLPDGYDRSYVSPVLDDSFLRRAKHKESFQATPPNDVKSSNSTRFSKDSSKQVVASPEKTELSSARPEVEKSSLKYCQIPSSSKQQQQEISSSITDQRYYGNCSRASPQGFPDSRRKVIENEFLSSLHQAHDFEPSSCQQQPEYSSQKDSSLVDPFASCSSQSESMLKSATSDDSCSIKAIASNPQKSQDFCDADLTMDSDLFDSPSQKILFELASPIEPIKKALCCGGDEEVPLKERGKHFRRRTSTLLTADEYNGNVDNGIDHGNEEDDNNVNDKDKSVICAEMEVNSSKDSGDDSVWFDAKCYNNEPFTIATCSTQTQLIRNSPQISPQKSVETDVSPVKTPLASSLCSQRNANSNPPQISSAESSSLGYRVSNEIEVNDIWERRLTEASGATVRANHRLSKLADALKRRQQTLRSDLAMWRCDMINSPVLKGSAGSSDKGCFDCAIDKANDALGIDKNSGKGNDNGRDVNSEQKCAMQIQLDDASSSLKRWGVCWRRGNEVGTGRSVLIADSEPLNLIGNGNLNAVSGSDSCCSEHVDSYYLSLYKPLAKSELEQNSEKLMILLAPRFYKISKN